MSISFHHPLLLVGGNGKVGHRVAQRLARRGFDVRIGSRSGAPRFDWNDASAWSVAIDGVHAAYVAYYPDLALPGADEAVQAFTSLAVQKGLKRLVLLSGRGEEEAQKAEQVLMASGADWTIVRPSWFAQNFSKNFFLDGILAGRVAFPRDGVLEPFIDAEDIADVVAAAVTGRDIRYVPVSLEDYGAELRQQDVPAVFITLLERLTREVLDGRNAQVTEGVRKVLGRAPHDFSEYVRATARTGVWGK